MSLQVKMSLPQRRCDIIVANSSNLTFTGVERGDLIFNMRSNAGIYFGYDNTCNLPLMNVTPSSIVFPNVAGGTPRLIVNSNGFVGIGTSNPTESLHVIGNIMATGNIVPSDSNIKNDIARIMSGPALDSISHIDAFTFKYREDPLQKQHAGFLAQNVEQHLPILVSQTNNDTKTVSYQEMIPYMVEAIKDLRQQINELRQQINHS
jgi:hypothetical protein